MKKRKLLKGILVFILVFSQILFPVKKIWAEEIEPTVTYHKTITPMRDSNGNTIPEEVWGKQFLEIKVLVDFKH